MMNYLLAVISVFAVVQQGLFALECPFKGLDCADFTVDSTGNGYEKRTYPARSRVCDSKDTSSGNDFDNLRDGMYEPLAEYRQGANDQGTILNRAKPASMTKVEPGQLPSTLTLSMCFEVLESNVPNPTAKSVWLSNLGEEKYFVREFSGNGNFADYEREKNTLTSALDNDGMVYVADEWFIGSYDCRVIDGDRKHNEVWVAAI